MAWQTAHRTCSTSIFLLLKWIEVLSHHWRRWLHQRNNLGFGKDLVERFENIGGSESTWHKRETIAVRSKIFQPSEAICAKWLQSQPKMWYRCKKMQSPYYPSMKSPLFQYSHPISPQMEERKYSKETWGSKWADRQRLLKINYWSNIDINEEIESSLTLVSLKFVKRVKKFRGHEEQR